MRVVLLNSTVGFRRSSFGIGVLAALVLMLLASVAQAQTVVFAPHPDDEALFASGIIYRAHQAGQNVKVVVATNGDCEGGNGQTRQAESIAAMTQLGLAPSDVIFLGYPDCGLREIYYNYPTATAQYTSQASFNTTYGYYGLGNTDYHRYVYGVPAKYSGFSVIQDIQTVLRNYKPQDVYVTSAYDENLDHYALNFLVNEALVPLVLSDPTFQPTVHDALVHEPCELECDTDPDHHWPMPTFTPTVNMTMPAFLTERSPLGWGDAESVEVPAALQLLDPNTNLKSRAIAAYVSQGGSNAWLQSFVKRNEVFWKMEPWANLALHATAIASSNLTPGTTASRVNDGVVAGAPKVPTSRGGKGEWVATNTAGAWVQLTWPSARELTKIILHDRPEPLENITAGVLSFSDGSSIVVGALPTNGVGFEVAFTAKMATWVRFTVTTAAGTAAGLAEMEAYGLPMVKQAWALPPANTAPTITTTPTAQPSAISDRGSAAINVAASDANGDTLTYSWSVDAGRIEGTGASVTFIPPAVATATPYQIRVHVADGRGGIVTDYTTVTVSPAPGPRNIAGSATPTASTANVAHGQTAEKVLDGIVSGYPVDANREWASDGQLAGAWIQLTWAAPQQVCRTVLHDRINLIDQVRGGTLRFSDGSSIPVGALPNDGTGLSVTFGSRNITWIRFEVTSAVGGSAGLAEWEVLPAPGACASPRADLNADGISDVLLQHETASAVAGWLMNASGQPSTFNWIYQGDTNGWKVVGSADLNGDGIADIILQHATASAVGAWLMNASGTPASFAWVYQADTNGWKVKATADVNGDGITDIILQHATASATAAWLMNSSGTPASFAWIYQQDTHGWKVVGSADLNNDGIDDLILQHDTASAVGGWLMNASGQPASFTWIYQDNTNGWKVAGTTDLDGDGITDIILQHSQSYVAAWLLDPNGRAASFRWIFAESTGGWKVNGKQ